MFSNLHSPAAALPRPHSRRRRYLQLFLLLTPLCTLLTIASLYAQSGVVAPASIPSGAPTAPPTSPASVYVPWVSLAGAETAPYLEGQLTLGSSPLAGALVELRQCDNYAPEAHIVLTSTTDQFGYYLADLPTTPTQIAPTSTLSYSVTLLAPPPLTATATLTEVLFASFKSNCLPTAAGPVRLLPTLDLAAPQVITPSLAITVDMPVIFSWQGRTSHTPNGINQWFGSVQFDCGACPPILISSQPLTATAQSVEWCSMAPHYSGVNDVAWVDYFLRVTNDLGTGDASIRRVNIGVTTKDCPPLPEP